MNVIFTSNKEQEKSASRIYEMRVIDGFMPYQSNISSLDEVDVDYDIIGIWNDDGSIVQLDIKKYRNALNDIKVYDDDCNLIESKRPTLVQAKKTQVNVFNNQFVRELV